MQIFLADLFHVYHRDKNPDTSPYTIPLGIGYLASTLKTKVPGSHVRLFRDPDKLLAAVRTSPPAVVGFSFCSWNTDLTRQLIGAIKSIDPAVAIVAGGPSIDDEDGALVEFLTASPLVDFAVPNEGESGLIALMKHLEQPAAGAKEPIPGVAFLDENGALVRGRYKRPIVPSEDGGERISPKQVRAIEKDDIEIPSPYLDGTLDEFLEDGLVPIIQTMRGCPYQCHFCVSGATEWNRMRGYALDRVKAEIDYALAKSSSKDLILTDENWGILGERDVELARFIMAKNKREGLPKRLYYYTAKVVTPASREIVELVAPIAWIAEFSMSFQSLNPDTRKAIKRTNIGMDKLGQNILWAQERKITTSSEMIYGFPHENPDSFFDGIETLAREGVDRVTIYPLQLFPGIDLASKAAREKFGFETRFRAADCAYGVYDGGNILAVESEEVVIANSWSSEQDYLTVRRYAFVQQVMTGRLYFADLANLCRDLGQPFDPLIRFLATADYAEHPELSNIMAAHRIDAEAELMRSHDEVRRAVADQLVAGGEGAGAKVNLVYLGKIMASRPAIDGILHLVRGYFQELGLDAKTRDILVTFIDEILPNQIAVLEPEPADAVAFETRFAYEAWSSRRIHNLDEMLLPEPVQYRAAISPVLKSNLRDFDNESRFHLQSIFDRTRRTFLRRDLSVALDARGNPEREAEPRLSVAEIV